MVQYFTNCFTLQDLTKERNRLARIHHPDMGGDLKVMQEINAQFVVAKKRIAAGNTYNPNYSTQDKSSTGEKKYYTSQEMNDFIWEELLRMFNKTQAKNLYSDWESWMGQDKTPGRSARTNQSRWHHEAEKVKAKREKERQTQEKAAESRKQEIIWVYDQIFKAREQGLLRNCKTTFNFSSFLYVKGNTAPYKEWFEQHGFIWDEKSQQWNFDKRPKVS